MVNYSINNLYIFFRTLQITCTDICELNTGYSLFNSLGPYTVLETNTPIVLKVMLCQSLDMDLSVTGGATADCRRLLASDVVVKGGNALSWPPYLVGWSGWVETHWVASSVLTHRHQFPRASCTSRKEWRLTTSLEPTPEHLPHLPTHHQRRCVVIFTVVRSNNETTLY